MNKVATSTHSLVLLVLFACSATATFSSGAEEQETSMSREPTTAPYLTSRPEVTDISTGRQLLVDDYLVEESSLTREFHFPDVHPASPVMKPDRPWESEVEQSRARGNDPPQAMPYSDGVWYDPIDALFKMWYMSGWSSSTCYAYSKDGLTWTKPLLDIREGTNIILDKGRDSSTVWLDHNEADPAKRFKMMHGCLDETLYTHQFRVSADGIHWGEPVSSVHYTHSDRSTMFYNPFRKTWAISLKHNLGPIRQRYYVESTSFPPTPETVADAVPWVCSDRLDLPRADAKAEPQLYNLDAVAYESLLLGFFAIWRGKTKEYPGRGKMNEVFLGFSRDGFHWDRPCRIPFVPASENENDWNYSNVQSVGGGCLVVGDKLYFYASGRMVRDLGVRQGFSSTGLLTLRRDGFASMNAGSESATLTTRPVRFAGKHLFVNIDNPQGELRVEILSDEGKPIEPHTREKCVPLQCDSTIEPVRWAKGDDLSSLAGKAVRLKFYMTKSKLYAFWVSPKASGASHGYVAAGGPGFTGDIDTVGRP